MNPWVAIPTFVATLSWVSVVVLYWLTAKWWKSTIGWNTMGISLTLALVLIRLTLLQTGVVFSTSGNIIFGFSVYAGLAFFGFQRTYLVWQSRQQKAAMMQIGVPNRRRDDPK